MYIPLTTHKSARCCSRRRRILAPPARPFPQATPGRPVSTPETPYFNICITGIFAAKSQLFRFLQVIASTNNSFYETNFHRDPLFYKCPHVI